MADNVPNGMEPSSAVACMSVMGFDPAVFYAGRGPIEAMAMGIELVPDQVAMRCNLVTVLDGNLVSYSAGNITSEESAQLITALRDRLDEVIDGDLGRDRLQLHAGVGFRHILTVKDGADLLVTTFTPPHDITDRPVAGSGPVGPGAGLVCDLMEWSKDVLAGIQSTRLGSRVGCCRRYTDLAVLAGDETGADAHVRRELRGGGRL